MVALQYEPTLSVRVFEPFVGHLRGRHPIDGSLPPPVAPTAKQDRVPHGAAIAALQNLMRVYDDPALGLHVAADLRRGSLDLLEYLAGSCETVRDAIDMVSRYGRLMHDALDMRLRQEGDRAVWSFGVARGLSWHPAAADFLAGVLVRGLLLMTSGEVQLREVRLRQPAPSYHAEYAAVFPCPVRFGSEEDAVVLAHTALDSRLSTADSRLRAVLERQAIQTLDAMPQQQTFAARVVTHVRHAVEVGDPRVEPVARTLGVSPRTLRRRLQEEGTSFGQLLDGVRREMALRWLNSESASIPDIARGLGFSRIPSFYRAFKRWTGSTPAEFRERAQ